MMSRQATPVPLEVLSDFRATLRQIEGVLGEFAPDSRVPECEGVQPAESFAHSLATLRARVRHGRALLLIEAEARAADGRAVRGRDALTQASAVLLDIESTITRLGELFESLLSGIEGSQRPFMGAEASQGS